MPDNIQYTIAVPEIYEKDGEEKTARTTVGTAFGNDSGNLTLNLPQHIAVWGGWCYFRKKMKRKNKSRGGGFMRNVPRRVKGRSGVSVSVCG